MLKNLIEKRNQKGFTLMEMLIVVAIIAILVAIAIPVFSSQLEKAKEATDLANIRAAISDATMAYLDGETDATKLTKTVLITQGNEGWDKIKGDDVKHVGGVDLTSLSVKKGDKVDVKYDAATSEVKVTKQSTTPEPEDKE